jgi:hypothetical protein
MKVPAAGRPFNPVLVIISLVFWFWMWGIPGAILSVPMLAIAKITCDRVRPLAAFGHFLGGNIQSHSEHGFVQWLALAGFRYNAEARGDNPGFERH